jgi:hypothetical protein
MTPTAVPAAALPVMPVAALERKLVHARLKMEMKASIAPNMISSMLVTLSKLLPGASMYFPPDFFLLILPGTAAKKHPMIGVSPFCIV